MKRMVVYNTQLVLYCCATGCAICVVSWALSILAPPEGIPVVVRRDQNSSAVDPDPGLKCPDYRVPDVTRKQFSKIKQMGAANASTVSRKAKVLIMTPVSNSADGLRHYFSLLCSLTYPHWLIHVHLGEDSSFDKTLDIATALANILGNSFGRVAVHKLSKNVDKRSVYDRHDFEYQKQRRAHLARVRNELLFRALDGSYDWVLWIDSDVIYYPPNLVELLLTAEEDIVVPACLQQDSHSNEFVMYDKNTWKDTPASYEYLLNKPSDFLMLEGYLPTKRKYLSDLRHEGLKVPIDGVGGCTLLVRASCHRQGLVFPPFILDHHIETEGLAKMASRMGFTIVGLPFVTVFHDV